MALYDAVIVDLYNLSGPEKECLLTRTDDIEPSLTQIAFELMARFADITVEIPPFDANDFVIWCAMKNRSGGSSGNMLLSMLERMGLVAGVITVVFP